MPPQSTSAAHCLLITGSFDDHIRGATTVGGFPVASVSDAYDKKQENGEKGGMERALGSAEATATSGTIGAKTQDMILASVSSSQPLPRGRKEYLDSSRGVPSSRPKSTRIQAARLSSALSEPMLSPAGLRVQSMGLAAPLSQLSLKVKSSSQPSPTARTLRPRNDVQRSASSSHISSSQDTSVSDVSTSKILLTGISRKASGKRKREEPEDKSRSRPRTAPKESKRSENSAIDPGRTSDGKINYTYYVNKYLNQRRQKT